MGVMKSAAKTSSAGTKTQAAPKKGKTTTGLFKKRWPKKQPFHKKLIKWGLWVIALGFLIPTLFMVLYIPSFMHPPSTLMAIEFIQGKPVSRKWVALEDISPHVYRSVIMSEDGQFCSHHGIDLRESYHVLKNAVQGKGLRGASTITMQTVKNMVLWPGRSLAALLRKMFEVPLAPVADLIWSKKRIMELYLNVAEWGPGIFGIEAAAQHYFKRSSKRLTARQAALLAVTLPNPIVRNPKRPSRRMKFLAKLVQRRAQKSGAYVTCLAK